MFGKLALAQKNALVRADDHQIVQLGLVANKRNGAKCMRPVSLA
jgi:hypothetical protein